jgi:hypothetical protein
LVRSGYATAAIWLLNMQEALWWWA